MRTLQLGCIVAVMVGVLAGRCGESHGAGPNARRDPGRQGNSTARGGNRGAGSNAAENQKEPILEREYDDSLPQANW